MGIEEEIPGRYVVEGAVWRNLDWELPSNSDLNRLLPIEHERLNESDCCRGVIQCGQDLGRGPSHRTEICGVLVGDVDRSAIGLSRYARSFVYNQRTRAVREICVQAKLFESQPTDRGRALHFLTRPVIGNG